MDITDADGDLNEIEEIVLAREAGSGYRACRCHHDAPAPGAPVICPMHGVKEGT
jgi:hypothetical protein